MKYKAVVFDLFGTLVDVTDKLGYASALRETASILKIKPEDFLRLWQETSDKRVTGGFKTLEENLEYIVKQLGMPVKPADVNLAKMVRFDYLEGSLTPLPYAVETLTELKKQEYKIALVSNCSVDIPVIWPHTPIAPFFDKTIFSSTCGLQKPDPQIYKMAIEQLGVKPEECLFVDDNPPNLEAAAKIGMTAVLIRDPEENPEQPTAEPIGEWNGLTITSLPEVLDILEGVHEV